MRRKWSGQDVPSAARRGCSARARKSRTAGVDEVPDLRPVGRRQPTDEREQRGRPRLALSRRAAARSPGRADRTARACRCAAMNASARPDDLERARLALRRRVAPGGDAVAAEDRPRWRPGDARGSPRCRARAGTPAGATAPSGRVRRSSARSGPRRQPRSPGRSPSRDGGGRRGRVHEAVHRGVDRRCRAARPCRQKSNAATISSSRSTPG